MPMTLSTITFTATLNHSQLPVDEMRLAVEVAEELDDDSMEFTVDCDQAKKKHRADTTTTTKRFRYQLPLKRNGKSVKLFHNGSVHATGCASPLEFLEMMEALMAFIKDTGNIDDVHVVDFDIQLINTLFLVVERGTRRPVSIAPGGLLKQLPVEMRADFDTERHPSVKIPLLVNGVKAATVCVFQTGSVSIMGAKSPEHVASAYEMVMAKLDSSSVCVPDLAAVVRTTTAKQSLTLVDGYPFNLHACCLF